MPSAWLTSWTDLRDFRRSFLLTVSTLTVSFSIFINFSLVSLSIRVSGVKFSERKSNGPIGHVIVERNGRVAFPFLKNAWTMIKMTRNRVVVRSCTMLTQRKQASILEFLYFYFHFFIEIQGSINYKEKLFFYP